MLHQSQCIVIQLPVFTPLEFIRQKGVLFIFSPNMYGSIEHIEVAEWSYGQDWMNEVTDYNSGG